MGDQSNTAITRLPIDEGSRPSEIDYEMYVKIQENNEIMLYDLWQYWNSDPNQEEGRATRMTVEDSLSRQGVNPAWLDTTNLVVTDLREAINIFLRSKQLAEKLLISEAEETPAVALAKASWNKAANMLTPGHTQSLVNFLHDVTFDTSPNSNDGFSFKNMTDGTRCYPNNSQLISGHGGLLASVQDAYSDLMSIEALNEVKGMR